MFLRMCHKMQGATSNLEQELAAAEAKIDYLEAELRTARQGAQKLKAKLDAKLTSVRPIFHPGRILIIFDYCVQVWYSVVTGTLICAGQVPAPTCTPEQRRLTELIGACTSVLGLRLRLCALGADLGPHSVWRG